MWVNVKFVTVLDLNKCLSILFSLLYSCATKTELPNNKSAMI